MTDKVATSVWVVSVMGEGFLGAFETREKAIKDAVILAEQGKSTKIDEVMLLGWAFDRKTGRIHSNDDPTPPTSGTVQ